MTEQTQAPALDWFDLHRGDDGASVSRATVATWLWLTVTRQSSADPFILRSPLVPAYLLSETGLAAAQREAELATKRQLEHAIKMLS